MKENLAGRKITTRVGNIEKRFQGKFDKLQDRYDDETKHGSNKSDQETWNKRIAAEKQEMNGSDDNLP